VSYDLFGMGDVETYNPGCTKYRGVKMDCKHAKVDNAGNPSVIGWCNSCKFLYKFHYENGIQKYIYNSKERDE